MTDGYDTITFLSDYGRADEFVGVVHSVLRSIAPHAAVVDLTHDVGTYDIRGAGLLLARSVQYLCPGVVLAVVDPGVGTDRRGVAVSVGEGRSVLVGPDNGLLAPAVAMCGGADRAVSLTNEEFQLPRLGATFDGRDVFAPVAAHLAAGVALEELGDVVEPAGLFPGMLPLSRLDDGVLHVEVLWVDRYGNAQLNAGPDELDALVDEGDPVEVTVGETTRIASRVEAFAELGSDRLGVLTDSYGLLALVLDRDSACEALGARPGIEITLCAVDDGGVSPAGVTTSVQLGRSATAAGGIADGPAGPLGGTR